MNKQQESVNSLISVGIIDKNLLQCRLPSATAAKDAMTMRIEQHNSKQVSARKEFNLKADSLAPSEQQANILIGSGGQAAMA